MATEGVPGFEGTVGPGPGAYGRPHVYARDVTSGAGNCVCGADLGSPRHTEAAPGVPVPDWARRGARTEYAAQPSADRPAHGAGWDS
ncbi:hypothetical protein [Frankia sp. CcI49]|uniref:hypothetical protein n=1 Tax=Frankia sp. CcI49 TaxID=1745382 RepID=UPI001055BC7E|nr:hypothetical protein [Frankia sp. CcI49]